MPEHRTHRRSQLILQYVVGVGKKGSDHLRRGPLFASCQALRLQVRTPKEA